jgi:CubicO group peptidase (beta-lactamase class C family)
MPFNIQNSSIIDHRAAHLGPVADHWSCRRREKGPTRKSRCANDRTANAAIWSAWDGGGLVIKGRTYIYYYGVASKATGRSVTSNTLFEIGSVSRTFTATLASYAQVKGRLSLSDSASGYLSSLRGSSLDKVSLLNLGTHTPGGMPLQVTDNITNKHALMDFLRTWKPA